VVGFGCCTDLRPLHHQTVSELQTRTTFTKQMQRQRNDTMDEPQEGLHIEYNDNMMNTSLRIQLASEHTLRIHLSTLLPHCPPTTSANSLIIPPSPRAPGNNTSKDLSYTGTLICLCSLCLCLWRDTGCFDYTSPSYPFP
jgi:hypothetical protein